MKELNIEEKAKRYELALEKCRKLYNEAKANEYISDIEDYETIFPELAESEDERIRKELIRAFKSLNTIKVWNGIERTDILAWLEKQGEQKPYGQREECVDCQFNYAGKCKGSCVMKRDEQKPADEVKPKFKVGDWILYSGDHYEGVRHITKIDENGYYIERNGLPHGIIPFNHEICMRLWTIQDANDGDVLFAENFDNIGGCVFLFKGLDSWKFDAEGDRAIATGYCCTSITESGNTDFGIQGPDCVEITRVHPATKSQRDLLFQKMHEAGYEWDAEKKELKLLITNGGDFCEAENCEQKPIDYNEELKKLK